jgi:hypothetical protein
MFKGRVRAFVPDDIPRVAGLYRAIFPGNEEVPPQRLEAYLAEVFFHNPWQDPALPSLVYEPMRGGIVGFLGVIPRPMVWNGRPLRAAVSSSFMVDPRARWTMAGVELLKAFLAGPQDLSLTDAANDASRGVWERLGGTTALLYSLRWTRILRPYRYTMHLVRGKRPILRRLAVPLDPLGCAVDAVGAWVRPNRFPQLARQLLAEELEGATLIEGLAKLSGGEPVQPIYTLQSLAWLLRMAAKKRQYGPLRKRVVRRADGAILGWWLYYLQRGGISRVLQLGAAEQSIHDVLNHLFYDAWRHGSTAISGRFQPRFLQAFSAEHCTFKSGTWMLVHAHDSRLLQAIYRGEAMLTPLEGEWWTCFLELIPAVNACDFSPERYTSSCTEGDVGRGIDPPSVGVAP